MQATKTRKTAATAVPGQAADRGPRTANELNKLANIGPAMLQDFALLGIDSIEQLARQDPDELYLRLQKLTRSDQDPCVWDTFAAAIHEARTGERTRWWDWTPLRKEREMAGQFRRRP